MLVLWFYLFMPKTFPRQFLPGEKKKYLTSVRNLLLYIETWINRDVWKPLSNKLANLRFSVYLLLACCGDLIETNFFSLFNALIALDWIWTFACQTENKLYGTLQLKSTTLRAPLQYFRLVNCRKDQNLLNRRCCFLKLRGKKSHYSEYKNTCELIQFLKREAFSSSVTVDGFES